MGADQKSANFSFKGLEIELILDSGASSVPPTVLVSQGNEQFVVGTANDVIGGEAILNGATTQLPISGEDHPILVVLQLLEEGPDPIVQCDVLLRDSDACGNVKQPVTRFHHKDGQTSLVHTDDDIDPGASATGSSSQASGVSLDVDSDLQGFHFAAALKWGDVLLTMASCEAEVTTANDLGQWSVQMRLAGLEA